LSAFINEGGPTREKAPCDDLERLASASSQKVVHVRISLRAVAMSRNCESINCEREHNKNACAVTDNDVFGMFVHYFDLDCSIELDFPDPELSDAGCGGMFSASL
jgi:hypothetical protein